jgi:serine/threonine protein kinase
MTFSWNASRIRSWFITPEWYASSRLIDVANEDHHEDLAKMLLYLLNPVEQVLPQWQPPASIPVWYPGRNEDRIERTWRVREESSTPPKVFKNGVILRRNVLVGGRTAITAGYMMTDEGEVPVVSKAVWLEKSLAEHEFRILDLLAHHEPHVSFPNANRQTVASRPDLISQISGFADVKKRFPNPLGISMPDNPWLCPFRAFFSQGGRIDHFQEKVLVVIHTKGDPEIKIPDIPDLTLKQMLSIYADVSRSLHYCSCLGVHHRDLNLGNIMARRDPASNSYWGLLMDFGNAAYAGEPRRLPTCIQEHKEACKEDGRSANRYFQCLDSLMGEQLAQTVEVRQTEHARYIEAEGDPQEIAYALDNLREAQEKLEAHILHRYTSDLESKLYCLCFQVRRSTPSCLG